MARKSVKEDRLEAEAVEASVIISRPSLGTSDYPAGREQPRGVSSTDMQEAEPYFKAGMEVELREA